MNKMLPEMNLRSFPLLYQTNSGRARSVTLGSNEDTASTNAESHGFLLEGDPDLELKPHFTGDPQRLGVEFTLNHALADAEGRPQRQQPTALAEGNCYVDINSGTPTDILLEEMRVRWLTEGGGIFERRHVILNLADRLFIHD